jgi:hypothetical protein
LLIRHKKKGFSTHAMRRYNERRNNAAASASVSSLDMAYNGQLTTVSNPAFMPPSRSHVSHPFSISSRYNSMNDLSSPPSYRNVNEIELSPVLPSYSEVVTSKPPNETIKSEATETPITKTIQSDKT